MKMCRSGQHDLDAPGARRKARGCHECFKAYQRAWAQSERQGIVAFMDAWKVEQGCAHCGYNENPAALQLDHKISRWRLGETSKSWNGAKSMAHARKVQADPNIQVLCANCHCIKTRVEGDQMAWREQANA